MINSVRKLLQFEVRNQYALLLAQALSPYNRSMKMTSDSRGKVDFESKASNVPSSTGSIFLPFLFFKPSQNHYTPISYRTL